MSAAWMGSRLLGHWPLQPRYGRDVYRGALGERRQRFTGCATLHGLLKLVSRQLRRRPNFFPLAMARLRLSPVEQRIAEALERRATSLTRWIRSSSSRVERPRRSADFSQTIDLRNHDRVADLDRCHQFESCTGPRERAPLTFSLWTRPARAPRPDPASIPWRSQSWPFQSPISQIIFANDNLLISRIQNFLAKLTRFASFYVLAGSQRIGERRTRIAHATS
jgi:hypothetical protein